MKSTLLTGLLLLLMGAVATAQLSFLPQIGFEQSRTSLNYGNALSASGINSNFKASLKLNYQLKGGHSPFVNLTTSPSPVKFAFNNAGSLMESYQAANDLRLRFEAGYQFTTRPILLGKGGSVFKNQMEAGREGLGQKNSCGSLRKTHCGGKAGTKQSVLSGLSMRLQPALALAYIPSNNDDIKQTATGFEYSSATWKTAIVPSMAFEFDKGRQRLFTLTVFYTKPLGNQEEMITNFSGPKSFVTNLSSQTSTWGMTVGVPFNFTKANGGKMKNVRKECSRVYHRRCSKI